MKIALIHFEIANLICQIKDFSQNKYFIDLTLSRGKKLKNSQFDCLLSVAFLLAGKRCKLEQKNTIHK